MQLITKNVTNVLGIGDRLGTIKVGKEAMIIVSEGDILHMKTNQIMAFIQSRNINLNDKNRELYERFLEKYEKVSK